MVTTKVYGSIISTRTQRVLIVLEETGTAYELIEINMQKGEHKDPTYIAERHPFGRLPAFEDDSGKLFESRAISRYLAKRYSDEVDLLGTHSEPGLFELAASVEYSYFDRAIEQLAYEKNFKKMMGRGNPDKDLVSLYEGQLRECFDYYEDLLARQKYLAGNNYTLVDIFHVPWFAFLQKSNLSGLWQELGGRPHLLAWWHSVSERAAWKRVADKTNSGVE